jgi:predicted TIM-barrel fold metal-dependent hydrolase
MLIDGFTVFGTWPGLHASHPVEELIEGITKYKLERACTMSSAAIFLDAAAGNDDTFAACRKDARLIPIGVADPRIDGIAQVDHCKANGFRMVALFPASQGWSLGNIVARQVINRIADVGLPLMIEAGHEGDASAVLGATADLAIPVLLLDVSLPTLSEAMAVLKERPNTYLTTRLLTGGDTIEMLAGALGADRLVFASRFPMSCYSSAFLNAQYANLSNEDRAKVMGNNLMKIFGLM